MKRFQFRVGIALGAAILISGIAAMGSPRSAHASPAFDAAKSCRKQLTVQGRNYYKKRLTHILNCVDKLLKCEILFEVDSINVNNCRAAARDSCNARLGSQADSALSKAIALFDTKTATACLALDIGPMLSTSAGGLWFGNDGSCGTSADVPTLVQCVRDEVEDLVDGVVAQVKPRAALLLGNAGLGDEFPNIPLPPATDVVISATAAGSGVLVNPGTINVPQGNVLRITGDSTTLPCSTGMGNGNNGKLTITVGSQEQQITEPYGPSEVALFGPYTATATIPYLIDLKDQGCMDQTSGDVSVP
ncbi:MAG TPA: hypothetical protein VFD92_15670 [Candidatus Binatia bacterium]|nr:hypothetical protein [Candidatus Binatia bacterium]